MTDRIKNAFDIITADEKLKEATKAALLKKCKNSNKREANSKFQWKKAVLMPVCAVIICVVGFGLVSYNIQVSAISIDINPSIELGLNRYDRVISTNSFNEEGKNILDSVNIINKTYEDATRTLLECKEAQKYMTSDNTVVVTVDAESDDKALEVICNIEKCGANSNNLYCYKNSESCTDTAHSNNVSFGKYNAYLELKKYEPKITIDEVKNLTMRQIRERIQSYVDSDSENEPQCSTEACTKEASSEGCSNEGYSDNSNSNGKHHGWNK